MKIFSRGTHFSFLAICVISLMISGCEGCNSQQQSDNEADVGNEAPVSAPVEPTDTLKIDDIFEGEGAEAKAGKKVSVFYTGTLVNGKKFDSNVGRDPLQFVLGNGLVIQGWEQGLLGLKVGGKRKLIIPPHMAYGSRGFADTIPPNSTLVFEVELVDVSDK